MMPICMPLYGMPMEPTLIGRPSQGLPLPEAPLSDSPQPSIIFPPKRSWNEFQVACDRGAEPHIQYLTRLKSCLLGLGYISMKTYIVGTSATSLASCLSMEAKMVSRSKVLRMTVLVLS